MKEAAYGRATVEQLDSFLASEPLTLEAADAWLSNLGAAPQSEGPDLSALSAEALLDALVEGGLLAERVALREVERAIWQRAQVLLGLAAEEHKRFREERRSAATGGNPHAGAASDVLFALVSWVLKADFVHDLKRAPRVARLGPFKQLPTPAVEACQKVARHLRNRYSERYARWADECEEGITEELEATTAEDLGQVDTFRTEDQRCSSRRSRPCGTKTTLRLIVGRSRAGPARVSGRSTIDNATWLGARWNSPPSWAAKYKSTPRRSRA